MFICLSLSLFVSHLIILLVEMGSLSITCFCSLPTTLQSTSTSVSTLPPFTLPPPKSICAKRARALSNDQACSGGTNIAELLTNQSTRLDTARSSRLYSYLCSSQSCFNKYVKTLRACLIDLSGGRGNATAKKSVRLRTF